MGGHPLLPAEFLLPSGLPGQKQEGKLVYEHRERCQGCRPLRDEAASTPATSRLHDPALPLRSDCGLRQHRPVELLRPSYSIAPRDLLVCSAQRIHVHVQSRGCSPRARRRQRRCSTAPGAAAASIPSGGAGLIAAGACIGDLACFPGTWLGTYCLDLASTGIQGRDRSEEFWHAFVTNRALFGCCEAPLADAGVTYTADASAASLLDPVRSMGQPSVYSM